MSPPGTAVLALEPAERAGLAAYLARLLRLDPAAAVRIQAGGSVAGVWSGPPLDVLALRPVRLAEPCGADRTVAAAALHAAVQRPVRLATHVPVPAAVVGVAWAGVLPPRTGWEPGAVVSVASVREAVGLAVAAFRRRVDPASAPAAQQRVATAVWQEPGPGGVPLRAAHAAELLGLLGPPEGEVAVLAAGPWWRLACPGGSVAVRVGAPLGVLDLAALLG